MSAQHRMSSHKHELASLKAVAAWIVEMNETRERGLV